MNTITIDELEQLDKSQVTIIDVRPAEDFRRGTVEGAVDRKSVV